MTEISDPLLDHLGRLVRDDPFPVGLVIDDRYEIRHLIARGGMGEIFGAWDHRLDRPVAMKVLQRDLSTPEWSLRFDAEARTMASIDHSGIVPIYDRGRLPDGRYYFTMKLIEGRTLDDAIESREPRDRLLNALASVADVVQYAHDREVIHRDLKPANVMVDSEDRVYVLDWGIARVREEIRAASGVLGTIEFMPPEQARGDLSAVDKRSDVYSLGALLYKILTGRPPVGGSTATEMLNAAEAGTPLAPRHYDRSLPIDLEAVCLKAIAKDPSKRYASARDFAEDVRRFRRGEPVEGRTIGFVTRWMRSAWRRKSLLAASFAGIAVLAAMGAWIVASVRKARRNEAARERLALQTQAQEEALRWLEEARPSLEAASRSLYDPETRYEDVVRRVDEGQRWIERAIERAPDLAAGHYLWGWAWELKGWDEEAEACWRKALELDPQFGRARFRLGRLFLTRAFLASIASSEEERHRKRSEAERWAEEAEREIETALFASSRFDDALWRDLAAAMLAYARQERDNFLRAVDEGIVRWQGTEGVEECYWLKSLVLGGEDRTRFLDEAIARRPAYPLALFSRAVTRFEQGDLPASVSDYTAALRLHPRFVAAYLNRGVTRKIQRDLAGALADYGEAIQLRPADAAGYYNRGLLRMELGDRDAALEDFEEAIRCHPRFAEAYGNRAALRYQEGDLSGALRDFDRLLEIHPEDVKGLRNRALVRQGLGDFSGAAADDSELLRRQPRAFDTYWQRAQIRKHLGDSDGAADDLRSALRWAPPDWPFRRRAEALLAEFP